MDPNQTTPPPTPPQQNTPASGAPHNSSLDLAESFAPMPSFSSGATAPQPTPEPAPEPTPEPIPEPVILHEETVSPPKPPVEEPHAPVSNIIMPQKGAPAPEPEPGITSQQDAPAPKPARTSMYENEIRGVGSPSPKDYGLVPEANRTSTPPPGSLAPQKPHRMSAQDAMYQSALGAPLEGPVIPSTRPQLQGVPEESRASSFARPVSTVHDTPRTAGPAPLSRLPQGALAVTPTPTEAQRDVSAPEVVSETSEERAREMARRSAIRTLEGDVASTIAKNSLSVSEIALAQQRKMAGKALETLPEEKKFSWWALSGIVLALMGVSIVVVAYLMQARTPEVPAPIITTQDALIPSVPETLLDITDMTRTNMIRTLSELPRQYLSGSGISLVRLIAYKEELIEEETVRVETDVSAEQFFAQTSLRAPSRLARALGKQTFFGVVAQQGRAIPFLVFEVVTYDSAFAGMLEWEQYLPDDVPFLVYTPPAPPAEPVAPSTPAENIGTSSTSSLPSNTSPATTTATGTPATSPAPAQPTQAPTPAPVSPLPGTTFIDAIIKNYDARVLRNNDGSTRMLYAFPNKALLLIAQDDAALSAIVDHLNTARFIR